MVPLFKEIKMFPWEEETLSPCAMKVLIYVFCEIERLENDAKVK